MPDMRLEQLLTRAVAAAGEVLRLLVRPDAAALDRSREELARAQACLEWLVESAAAVQPAARVRTCGELARLSLSLARARGLLEHGAGFWDGWVRLRNALTGGYTAAGGAAEPVADSRVSVEA